jgi:hypothetical protein
VENLLKVVPIYVPRASQHLKTNQEHQKKTTTEKYSRKSLKEDRNEGFWRELDLKFQGPKTT